MERRHMTPEDERLFFPLFFFVIWPTILRILYFQKAGEKPLKALIPFYGTYKFFDRCCHRRFFWIYLALWIMKICAIVFLKKVSVYTALNNTLDVLIYLISILPFATGAWRMGEGILFSVFTFILYPLFAAIFVFQKDPQKDPQKDQKNTEK